MSLFDSASLCVTPNGTKASKLYAIKPNFEIGVFPQTAFSLAVTRATTATRINSSGLIESVATNVPRLDYTNSTCPSILVEPQRTNATLRSDDFGNGYWGKFNTTITANNTTAPDGTTTADKIVETTANNFHSMDSTFSSGTGIYTASIYAKVGERRYLRLNITEITPAKDHTALFDLQTGTLLSSGTGVTASIINAGNGWYRIIVTSPALVGGQVRMAVLMQTTTSSTPQAYAGDGTSGLYIWGAQLEAGSYATSYIPTVASSVTRNADVISKTGISSLIGQTEGTIFLDVNLNSRAQFTYFALAGALASSQNYLGIFFGSSAIGFESVVTGALQAGINFSNTSTGRFKIAVGYKANDFVLYINGNLIGTDTSGSVPSCNDLSLAIYGTAATINYNTATLWKTRLSNTELATLTTI